MFMHTDCLHRIRNSWKMPKQNAKHMSNVSGVRCIRCQSRVWNQGNLSSMDGWIEGLMDGGRGLVGLRSFSTALHDRTEHEGRVMEGVEGVIEGPCSGARRSLLTCWITSLRCEGKHCEETHLPTSTPSQTIHPYTPASSLILQRLHGKLKVLYSGKTFFWLIKYYYFPINHISHWFPSLPTHVAMVIQNCVFLCTIKVFH